MIEMFIFANFVQKVNFEESHFQNVGVRLPELLLFVLGSLRVLGEQKLRWTVTFTIEIFIFANFVQKNWL